MGPGMVQAPSCFSEWAPWRLGCAQMCPDVSSVRPGSSRAMKGSGWVQWCPSTQKTGQNHQQKPAGRCWFRFLRRDECRFFSTAFPFYALCQQELINCNLTIIIPLKIVDVSKVATWYKRIGKPSTEHLMESWDRCTVETRFRLGRFQQSSRPRRSTPQDAGARKRPPRPVETGDVWHRSLTPNEIKDSNDLLLSVAVATQKVQSKRNQPTIPWFNDLQF